MHFVGFALEPAEVAVHAIPLAGFPGVVRGEAGFALDDEVLVGLREAVERAVDFDAALAAVAEEVVLALGGLAALERADDAFGDRERGVGDDALHVDADDAAEAFALGAGAEGGVETEEAGRGGADVEIAGGAMPTGGVGFDATGGGVDGGEAVVAEAEGGFEGFGEAGGDGAARLRLGRRRSGALHGVGHGRDARATFDFEAVLDDEDFGGEFFEGGGFVGAEGFSIVPDAEVALAGEEIEKVGGFCFFRDLDREGDEEGFSGVGGEDLAGDRAGGAGDNFVGALRAEGFGGAGEKELQVVVDLGDRADRGAGGADGVRLLDGDGGGDAFDAVGERFVHPLEELAGVGTECLYIPPLSLGVDGVEGEAGFAAAARSRNDNELPEGKLKVEGLEVVLPGSAEPYGIHSVESGGAG